KRYIDELLAAGYWRRQAEQARDELNRFGTFNYVVFDDPGTAQAEAVSAVHSAQRRAPMRKTYSGNKEEESNNNNLNNTLPKVPPNTAGRQQAFSEHADGLSPMGRAAKAAGCEFIFEGSEPFKAWQKFRGPDGMPPIDEVVIDGRTRRGV